MNRLVKIIETMTEEDLRLLDMDVTSGNMKKLINKRLTMVSDENKVCPVCNSNLSHSDFVLEFGEIGLRMKASFDGLDCLENFIQKLKKGGKSSNA